MEYGSQGQWREVGNLPSPRIGLRGATLNGVFFVSGGGEDQHISYTNDVVAFDPVDETWTLAGHLIATRKWHAVTEIDISNISNNCYYE